MLQLKEGRLTGEQSLLFYLNKKSVMSIEIANASDLDSIYELWKELIDFHSDQHAVFTLSNNPETETIVKEYISNKMKETSSRIFLYKSGNEISGILIARIEKENRAFQLKRKGYIAETVVSSKHRGKGIGKELYFAAEQWLKSEGADHIELQVSEKNNQAQKFWEELDFGPATYHYVKKL